MQRIKEVIIIRAADPDGSMFRAIKDALRGRRAEVIELAAPSHDILTFGDIEIHPDRRVVLKAGEEVSLNHGEFSMLLLLASAPGQVFSKDQLYDAAWHEEYRYNNYYEDMILELLNTLVPFTAEGFISYRGEKGDLWCHVFAGGEWTERSGRICYDEPRPQFEESKQNLARLIEEIRRQVIYDDRPYEDRARDLLKAFEAHDPDGVLLALSGRRLREHGVAAAIWQDGGESAHPDEGE